MFVKFECELALKTWRGGNLSASLQPRVKLKLASQRGKGAPFRADL